MEMDLGPLAKTNSWHWLAAALLVSASVSVYFWKKEIARETREHKPIYSQQAEHLAQLKSLEEMTVDVLNKQTTNLVEQMTAFAKEVEQAGFPPLHLGAGVVLETKSAIDRTLSQFALRILSNEITTPKESRPAIINTQPQKKHAQEPEKILTPEEFEAQQKASIVNLPKEYKKDAEQNVKKRVADYKKTYQARVERAQREAQRQREKELKVEAKALTKANFKTEEINYVVEGTYRNIFLFIHRISMQKTTYHLKDIAMSKIAAKKKQDASERARLQLTFTLEVNYL